MNKVELLGRIVKEVELQKSKEGNSYIKNTLAVRKDKDNTLFIDFMIFGKPAEAVQKYCQKGDRIIICGAIDINDVETDSKKYRNINIIASDFYFVDYKKLDK